MASAPFLLAVAIGAALTVILATRFGFPISTTHGLMGALSGAGLLAVGSGVNFAALGKGFVLPLLLSPLLAIVALVSPIPAFVADTRYGWRGYNFARWASPIRRRMDYLTTLVTTDTYAKEVKLFGLGPYFIDCFRQLSTVNQDRQRGLVVIVSITSRISRSDRSAARPASSAKQRDGSSPSFGDNAYIRAWARSIWS